MRSAAKTKLPLRIGDDEEVLVAGGGDVLRDLGIPQRDRGSIIEDADAAPADERHQRAAFEERRAPGRAETPGASSTTATSSASASTAARRPGRNGGDRSGGRRGAGRGRRGAAASPSMIRGPPRTSGGAGGSGRTGPRPAHDPRRRAARAAHEAAGSARPRRPAPGSSVLHFGHRIANPSPTGISVPGEIARAKG